ncbi:DNA/RNA polymerase, partial [Neocallimastix lanati (nom. inval.)]
ITHIIASQLSTAKIKEYESASKIIVKPSWIVDSINQKKLRPTKDYALFNKNSISNMLLNNNNNTIINNSSSSIINNYKIPSTSNTNNNNNKSIKSNVRNNLINKNEHIYLHEVATSNTLSKNELNKPIEEYNKIENNKNIEEEEEEINKSLETKWDVNHSSIAPNFIANYYENSRLHYLSLWRNKLKSIINSRSKNKQKTKKHFNETKFVMHVDMDCFFVSVGLISRPWLVDKPVGVSHSSGKNSSSDIASCNYIARSFGVKNGMLKYLPLIYQLYYIRIFHAKKLCPKIEIIPYEFENYEKATTLLYNILIDNSDNIQAVSCDEAYIEIWLPNTGNEEAEILQKAKYIRSEIKKVTECNASIGISTNMLLARLATKKAKPNGEFYISSKNSIEYVQQFSVTDLPGVGWSIENNILTIILTLLLKNINTCKDLQRLSLSTLQKDFGKKNGEKLYNLCRGVDNRNLNSENNERKSISAEITWGIRFSNNDQFKAFINEISKEVSQRMENESKKGQKLTIKLKIKKEDAGKPIKRLGHGSCKNVSKSINLNTYIFKQEDITKHSWNIISNLNLDPKVLSV